MPKLPKRSVVSDKAIEAFKGLQEQIEAAEKLLRKLPGARTSDAKVYLSEIFPQDHSNDMGTSLQLVGDPGELRVCNCIFNPSDGEEECSTKRLVDYSAVTRIAIAKKIPELIQLARAAEGTVVEAAREAAASIEQAISEHLEV
ncbi:MAG: hypothetical protein KGQ60_00630 [Planctomycetes bacterium]|nr:hypothetical protein [Planctomycetota bacterium]